MKWGKKMFKWYLKSEHTHGRMDGRTHRRTFRLIESIGPEGRCFENRLNILPGFSIKLVKYGESFNQSLRNLKSILI